MKRIAVVGTIYRYLSHVQHMADRLKEGPDGKPLRFKETTVSNLVEFLANFEFRNVTDDSELQALVAKARELLHGVNADDLRTTGDLRTKVQQGMAEIAAQLDGGELGAGFRQECATAHARGAHEHPGGKRTQALFPAISRSPHDDVGRGRSLGDAQQRAARGERGGEILGRVHRHVGASFHHLSLDLGHEQSLASDRGEGAAVLVPFRRDGDDLHGNAWGTALDRLCHRARLGKSELGAAVRDDEPVRRPAHRRAQRARRCLPSWCWHDPAFLHRRR